MNLALIGVGIVSSVLLGCGSTTSSSGSNLDAGSKTGTGGATSAGGGTGAGGVISAAGGAGTGGTSAGGATSGSLSGYTFIRLRNDLCSVASAPTNGPNGLSACRIFLFGVSGGCNQPGLSPATAAEAGAVTAQAAAQSFPPSQDPICEVTQLAASSVPNSGCANQAVPGWCYVQGSCQATVSPCKQDFCTTAAYDNEHFAAPPCLACP
jgi:hypothetical protein